jgi:hypothetical protein
MFLLFIEGGALFRRNVAVAQVSNLALAKWPTLRVSKPWETTIGSMINYAPPSVYW